jgi:hypothetical protein
LPIGNFQNPVVAAGNLADRERLLRLFPNLGSCAESPFLALRPYVRGCPERFFDRQVHALLMEWLNARDALQRKDLQQHLLAASQELSMAMLFLRQINQEDWHDRPLTRGDDFQVASFIDNVLHPAYLRLSEGVLAPLIRPVAHFSRLDRKKSPDNMELFNLVEELQRGPLKRCVAAYNHTVRNGIGHGGITYLQSDIRYRDKKGNVDTLDVWSVVRLVDDMVDTCNALAAAFKLFFVMSTDSGYAPPHELLVEELLEETRSPWWSISGCMESQVLGDSQLLIYARPNSRDTIKVLWACVQTAALAAVLAPMYGRYFLSLRSVKGLPGWAAFDGKRLGEVRDSGAESVEDYAVSFGDGGFVYSPRPRLPRLVSRADTLIQSLRVHWPIVKAQFREVFGLAHLIGRDGGMHRNAWGYVLRGAVVLPDTDPAAVVEAVRRNRRRILKAASRQARESVSRWNVTRYLPLGYARVGVFACDYRRRRLGGFGLGPDLICTVQLQRIRRIKSPDIMGSEIESSGRWRIAWNRSWLESVGAAEDAVSRPG